MMLLPRGAARPWSGRALPRPGRRATGTGRAEAFSLEVCGSVCATTRIGFTRQGSRLGTSGAGALGAASS